MAMLRLYHVAAMSAMLMITPQAGFLQSQSVDDSILVGDQAKVTFGDADLATRQEDGSGTDVVEHDGADGETEADASAGAAGSDKEDESENDKLEESQEDDEEKAEKFAGSDTDTEAEVAAADTEDGALSFIQMMEDIKDDDLTSDSESETESHALNEAASNDDGEEDEADEADESSDISAEPDEEPALIQKHDDDDDDDDSEKSKYDAEEYIDVKADKDEDEEDEHPASHEEEDEDEGAASFLQVGSKDDGDEDSDQSGEEGEEDTVMSTDGAISSGENIAEMDGADREIVTDEKNEEQINEDLETQQEENEAADNNE